MEPFEETSCRQVRVGRTMVGIVGLHEIFSRLYAEQYEPDEGIVPELLASARQHNFIPSFSKGVYAEALLREFKEFCWQQDYCDESASGYGTWQGHPREEIPWYPTINDGRCDGCGACVRYCGKRVFGDASDGKVQVVEPFKCLVGCNACVRICSPGAISFPPINVLAGFRR